MPRQPPELGFQKHLVDFLRREHGYGVLALYIREVTEEKSKDPAIRATVHTNRGNIFFLEGPFKGQVNGQIQTAHTERGRYDELADAKYTDPGAIFDIMAVTVIQQNLHAPEAA